MTVFETLENYLSELFLCFFEEFLYWMLLIYLPRPPPPRQNFGENSVQRSNIVCFLIIIYVAVM